MRKWILASCAIGLMAITVLWISSKDQASSDSGSVVRPVEAARTLTSPVDAAVLDQQRALVERERARAAALSRDGVLVSVSENGAFEARAPLVPAITSLPEEQAVTPPDGGTWSEEEQTLIAGFQQEMRQLGKAEAREAEQ